MLEFNIRGGCYFYLLLFVVIQMSSHTSGTEVDDATVPVQVVYMHDAEVSAELDAELRTLLSTCFTKPQDHVFKDRRYFHVPYPHRFLIRHPVSQQLVACMGVHERIVEVGEERKPYTVGGVADLCVHESQRGKGFVGLMLDKAHAFMTDNHRFDFAMLFGKPEYYRSAFEVFYLFLLVSSFCFSRTYATCAACQLRWVRDGVYLGRRKNREQRVLCGMWRCEVRGPRHSFVSRAEGGVL